MPRGTMCGDRLQRITWAPHILVMLAWGVAGLPVVDPFMVVIMPCRKAYEVRGHLADPLSKSLHHPSPGIGRPLDLEQSYDATIH